MNLARFNYDMWRLSAYWTEAKATASLSNVLARLSTYSTSPTPDQSAAFRSALDTFNERLENASSLLPSNLSFRLFLEEIGATSYVGQALRQNVENIIAGNAISPSEMLVALTKFSNEFTEVAETVDTLDAGLTSLEVEVDRVESDECEFGALFPRQVLGENLDDLIKELGHLNRLVSCVMELQGIDKRSPKIRTIGASWWQIFLDLPAESVLVLVVALERIVALYKSNLEIKRLRNELAKNELSPEITKLIDEDIVRKVQSGVEAIAAEMKAGSNQSVDPGRANELEVQLKIELKHVALRLNQGAAYEVVAGLPVRPQDLTDEQQADASLVAQNAAQLASYEQALSMAVSLNIRGSQTHLLSASGTQDLPLLIAEENANSDPPAN